MVILDISMPNPRGIEATHQIKMIFPNMKVLILSMHREKEYFSQAMAAGADGYLLKEYADAEIFTAIEIIEQGGIYVSPLLSEEA
jgi:two-component system response regulator NreC